MTTTRTPILLSLLFLLLITLLSTTVFAAGCCIYSQQATTQCIDEGDPHPASPPTNPVIVSATTCTNDYGYWDTALCDDILNCNLGCCCAENIAEKTGFDCEGIGTFKPFESGSSCETICGESTQPVEIGGVVEYDEEPVEGVIVTIPNLPAIQPYTTGADGTFKLTITPTANAYDFTFVKDGCDERTITKTLTQPLISPDNFLDPIVLLNCDGGTSPCTPAWTCHTNPATTQCDIPYEYLCTDNNGCEEDTTETRMNPCTEDPCDQQWDCTPPEGLECDELHQFDCQPPTGCTATPENTVTGTYYKECETPEDECGINGIQDPETCDVDASDNLVFSEDKSQCKDYADQIIGTIINPEDQVICNSCQVNLANCKTCPAEPATICSVSQCEEPCPACHAANLCPVQLCTNTNPTNLQATYDGEKQTDIKWDFSEYCEDELISFTLSIYELDYDAEDSCEGTSTDTKTNIITKQTTYPSAIEDRKYCYQIQANLIDGEENPPTTNCACITTKKEEFCMEYPNRPFCGSEIDKSGEEEDYVFDCDNLGDINLIKKCGLATCEEGQCIAPTPPDEQTICEECNGLFGMYSHLSSSSDTAFKSSIDGFYCSQAEIRYIPLSPKAPLCYEDRTKTVTDALSDCTAVTACYNYNNKESCEQNHCNNQNLDGACAWNYLPDFGEQFGLGVCIPNNPEEIDCNQCENGLLGEFFDCTAAICQAYEYDTNQCYFNGQDCLNEGETTCEDYLTEYHCIGGQPAEIDISYYNDAAGEPDYTNPRESSTNEHKKPSLDYFGLGKCAYVDEECVKDADNFITGTRDDCYDVDIDTCPYDFEAPVTTLDVPETQTVFNLENSFGSTVTDNSYEEGIKTYFSLSSSQYPSEELDDLINSLKGAEGSYTLYYFSRDPAKNLEKIRSRPLVLDHQAPEGTVTYTIDQTVLYDPTYLSDITINTHFTDTNGPIHCDFNLTRKELDKLPELMHDAYPEPVRMESGTSFNFEYLLLTDGFYQLNWVCTDADYLGNKNIGTLDIPLNQDRTIYDPKPSAPYQTFNNEQNLAGIQLSVQTQNEASQCWYTNIKTGVEKAFHSTDNLNHIAIEKSLSPGIYIYDTSCEFNSGREEGDSIDRIIFAVDTLPPKTTLLIKSDSEFEPYTSRIINQAEFTYECLDNDQRLIIVNNENEVIQDFNFGTSELVEIMDCRNNQQVACTPYEPWNNNPFPLTAADMADGKVLHYYCIDKGGNEEQPKNHQPLQIRDIWVDIDSTEICTASGLCPLKQ